MLSDVLASVARRLRVKHYKLAAVVTERFKLLNVFKGLFKKIFVTCTFLAPVPVAVQLTEAFASFLHLSLHKRFCIRVKKSE